MTWIYWWASFTLSTFFWYGFPVFLVAGFLNYNFNAGCLKKFFYYYSRKTSEIFSHCWFQYLNTFLSSVLDCACTSCFPQHGYFIMYFLLKVWWCQHWKCHYWITKQLTNYLNSCAVALWLNVLFHTVQFVSYIHFLSFYPLFSLIHARSWNFNRIVGVQYDIGLTSSALNFQRGKHLWVFLEGCD